MANTKASLPTKKKILRVCVKLFLEKGYKQATIAEIIKEADVSASSFQNLFIAKDGVLTELVDFMFNNQFNLAKNITEKDLPPVCIYAVETSIQLTLTELNENLREIYTEAYTHDGALKIIHRSTARELFSIFGSYQPELTEDDFYNMEIGSAGIMRAYMSLPCDEKFTLTEKLHQFLKMSLRAYKVTEDEINNVLNFIDSLDIKMISERVIKKLFDALAMHYDFSLDGIKEITVE